MTTGRTFSYPLKDGKEKHGYTITVTPADPVTGKYPQITKKGFASDRAARSAMMEHLRNLDAEANPGKSKAFTLKEFYGVWIKEDGSSLRPRTLQEYEYTMEHYVLPELGRVVLSRLSHTHIESLYKKRSATLEPSTVHRIHRVLRTCLNRAVKWGYLDKSPMERVDAPEKRAKRRDTLSVQEARRLLEWLKPRRPIAYMACFLAVYTGMRAGEVAGLQWRDVDLDRGMLHIDRTRQRIQREDIMGPTKTTGSQRSIVVAPIVVEQLREWKSAQQNFNPEWHEGLLVVSLIDGSTQSPDTFVKGVRAAVRALGLPSVTFHDLRHTHATWLLESGVDLKTVSQRLGHSTITLTADTYAHVTESMQRKAVEKLDAMMAQDDKKNE